MHINNDNLIWYVCYGSNMHFKRFMCYLTGEEYPEYNLKRGTPCNNKSFPKEIKNIEIPYGIYFANRSITWNNYGTAFLKPKKGSGRALCRAYLITIEQYEHVKKHEGPKYQKEIQLEPIDNIPAVTFTHKTIINPYNWPSDKYLDCIKAGLTEMGYANDEIDEYLKNEIFNKDEEKYKPKLFVSIELNNGRIIRVPIYPSRKMEEQLKEFKDHLNKLEREKAKLNPIN